MIEIDIPDNISDHETKLLGPFTTRQVVSLIIVVIIAFTTFKASSSIFGDDNSLRFFFPVVFALIPGACGWIRLYGLPLEKFLLVFIKGQLLPKVRKYKVDNLNIQIDKQIESEIIAESKKQDKSKSGAQKKYTKTPEFNNIDNEQTQGGIN